jgi:hypothetical protein
MKFSSTQIVKTNSGGEAVLSAVAEAFSSLAEGVDHRNQVVEVKSLQATFASALRNDVTRFTIKPKPNGVLVTADTEFKPTTWFWICFVLGCFGAWVGCLLPVGLYFYQKHLVKTAIENGLKRVSDELEDGGAAASVPQTRSATGSNGIDEIERLAGLLQKGLIDKSEFDAAKRKALGIASAATPSLSDPFLEDNADPMIYVRRGGVVQKPYARSLLVKNFAKLVATDEFAYSPDGPWSPRDGFFS